MRIKYAEIVAAVEDITLRLELVSNLTTTFPLTEQQEQIELLSSVISKPLYIRVLPPLEVMDSWLDIKEVSSDFSSEYCESLIYMQQGLISG